MEAVARRSEGTEVAQADLRASQLQLLTQVQEVFENDKKLVLALEELKTKVSTLQQRKPEAASLPKRENLGPTVTDGDVLAAITPTEREVLEILRLEGPKAAPDLGKRLNKSREHTSRLMKKLYMEGYVDREANHAPFRYKLNESLRSMLESKITVTTEAPETP
jgi:DNA-binding MarR family transcriptional regulator